MPDKHTLRIFDEDLESLRDEVVKLGAQVERELARALTALMTGDVKLARDVVENDRQTDALQETITVRTAHILVRQHAMATDLRAILAASRIAPHLERIGDYAKNTAKRVQRLTSPVDREIAAQCFWMGERIRSMLRRVIDAYVRSDADLANVTWADDAELDAVYSKVFEHLLTKMRGNADRVSDGTQLLFIAKGLERAGDHVTDIAEEVYLMVTGIPLQGPRARLDGEV